MAPTEPSGVAEPSLEEVLERMQPRLKRILFRYRIPAQDAEDILQETFLIMVAKWGSIRNPDSWLLATLANRCVIYWRKYRSRLWDLVDTTILELLAESEAPVQESSDLRFDLDALLSALPERCRLVMHLRWEEQLSHAEIAEVMGITVKGVERQLARGLHALRDRARDDLR